MYRLALRMPNWVGDVLMTLPVIDSLLSLGIKIEVLGKNWLYDLFSAYNFPIYPIPKSLFAAKKVYNKILSQNVLLFTNSVRSAASASLAQKNTIGYMCFGRNFFLHDFIVKNKGLCEAEYFWNLANFAVEKTFGLTMVDNGNAKLNISDKATTLAKQILEKYEIKDNYLVVCPGATGRGEKGQSKIWPYWSKLANILVEKNITLVACPALNELDLFSFLLPKKVKIISDVDLLTYAAIMKKSSMVIANDSGPLHLAAAVQSSVLGLYGVSSPQRVAPKNAKILGKLGQWPTLEDVLHDIYRTYEKR